MEDVYIRFFQFLGSSNFKIKTLIQKLGSVQNLILKTKKTYQVDDASGSEPDGDEDGDELGEPVKKISCKQLCSYWFFVTP